MYVTQPAYKQFKPCEHVILSLIENPHPYVGSDVGKDANSFKHMLHYVCNLANLPKGNLKDVRVESMQLKTLGHTWAVV